MATYAAYRHIELDNIGYGKKRVLKPPGGGSSDIFGAGPEHGSPRRANKNASQSQLGTALYGNGDQVDSNGVTNGSGGNSTPESPRSSSSASTNGSNGKPGSGNPVTGDGYDGLPNPRSQTNGTYSTGSTSGSEKSSTDSSTPTDQVYRMRNRIPPGGYSSGLW